MPGRNNQIDIVNKVEQNNHIAMIKKYFKVAIRDLLCNKGYTAINISGLVIGVTCLSCIDESR